MQIITHRGLDPSRRDYFTESSFEAFKDQLSRGFGLEFDLQFTKDNKIVVLHDDNLKRISLGRDTRKVCNINANEILAMEFKGCHITSFDQLLKLIDNEQFSGAISAIHIKSENQLASKLNIILSYLEKTNTSKFIIFDITLPAAKYLKEKKSSLNLAPSVSHVFDIERYNNFVGKTLMDLETLLANKNIFSWAWLDEWDRTDTDNKSKTIYTKEIFNKLREANIKVAIVSPELHSTSPGLLGGEAHQDASTKEKLFARIKEITDLNPDAICTDYSDQVKNIKL